jgi:hypothetical protein
MPRACPVEFHALCYKRRKVSGIQCGSSLVVAANVTIHAASAWHFFNWHRSYCICSGIACSPRVQLPAGNPECSHFALATPARALSGRFQPRQKNLLFLAPVWRLFTLYPVTRNVDTDLAVAAVAGSFTMSRLRAARLSRSSESQGNSSIGR